MFHCFDVVRFIVSILGYLASLCAPLSPRTAIGAGAVFRYSEPRSYRSLYFFFRKSVWNIRRMSVSHLYFGIFSSLASTSGDFLDGFQPQGLGLGYNITNKLRYNVKTPLFLFHGYHIIPLFSPCLSVPSWTTRRRDTRHVCLPQCYCF